MMEMNFEPREYWELIRVNEKPSEKGFVFSFRSLEQKQNKGGYEYRVCVDRFAKTEDEAWNLLTEPIF